MRVTQEDTNRSEPASARRTAPKRAVQPSRAELIPLYDHEPFLFLVERERARADRAAARPPKAPRERPKHAEEKTATGTAAANAAQKAGQPKPSSDGVWGATTDNREFSLVIFRPRSRADRAGLVELLQCCVRTTDAVGVVDARRLGVLLPDTAADNAILFVKKVLALAAEQDVHLSHIVHTYPAAWPDEDSPRWNEPRRSSEDDNSQATAPAETSMVTTQAAKPVHSLTRAQRRSADRSVLSGLVNWLQSAARRPARREVRASA